MEDHWNNLAAVATTREACIAIDAIRARIKEVESLLEHILNGFEFPGHPGEPCHRSSWIPDETLKRWREIAFRNRK